MKRLMSSKKDSPSRLIKTLLFEGKNSVQIFLIVKDAFPNYDDTKLRNLISVHKAKHIKKM